MEQTRLTALVEAAARGEDRARQRLYELVYEQLQPLARAQLRKGARGDLNTTELVHEGYLRLFDGRRVELRSHSHFLALSSRVMRQVLVDHYRHQAAARRGGPQAPLTLEEEIHPAAETAELVLAVHEGLEELERLEPRLARVVECRFFGGMTQPEIGEALGVTERTVRSDWRTAKTWLAHYLEKRSA